MRSVSKFILLMVVSLCLATTRQNASTQDLVFERRASEMSADAYVSISWSYPWEFLGHVWSTFSSGVASSSAAAGTNISASLPGGNGVGGDAHSTSSGGIDLNPDGQVLFELASLQSGTASTEAFDPWLYVQT